MASNGEDLGTITQDYFYSVGSVQNDVTEKRVDSQCGNAPYNQDDNVSAWGGDDVEEGKSAKGVALDDEWGNNDKSSEETNSIDENEGDENCYSNGDTVCEVEGCVKDWELNSINKNNVGNACCYSYEDSLCEIEGCVEEYQEKLVHDEAPTEVPVGGKEKEVPELSEYEKLRERNIKERNEVMKELLIEINEAKQDLCNNAPKKRKGKVNDIGEPLNPKRLKVEVGAVRRSERERKPVNYVEDKDVNARSRLRPRTEFSHRRKSFSALSIGEKSTVDLKEPAPEEAREEELSRRKLRPRKPVCYTEMQEPDADSYIWCSGCDRLEYHGCEVHTTLFGDNKMFKLVVSKSGVRARNAGLGVFNKGNAIIPEGTLFGPYSGKFIPLSSYKKIENQGKESGNGWEVKDKEGKKIIGYVDPGLHPNPDVHWMSKVNCAMDVKDQNLVGFQLAGQIYYRAMQDIPPKRELLVYYGDSYAIGLGIDVKKYDLYRGREDQTKEVVMCEYCSLGIGSEGSVDTHSCQEKRDSLMVRKGETGERRWVCMECGKGFTRKQSLSTHGAVHSKVKKYSCTAVGCDKRYALQAHLDRHRRVVHEGFYVECDECGRRFGQKEYMIRHFKQVHQNEKKFRCPTCGIGFGRKETLMSHINEVHKQIKAFECEHCSQKFGRAWDKKVHIEAIHLGIRYPCTWEGCKRTFTQKTGVKFHVRRVHTKEWSWECQLCEEQKGIWWGCITPGRMDQHKAKNHPLEWEQEQEDYRREHPHICSNRKCLKRFATREEVDRHMRKLH